MYVGQDPTRWMSSQEHTRIDNTGTANIKGAIRRVCEVRPFLMAKCFSPSPPGTASVGPIIERDLTHDTKL